MSGGRLSRRRLLQLGMGAAVAGLAGRPVLAAAPPEELRIGAVLPTKTGLSPVDAATYQVAADAARQGIIMGEEEYASNAEMLGQKLKVFVATAPDARSAKRAAERLAAVEGVFAFIGGFDTQQALELGRVAAERKIPFFNIGASSDSLRGSGCGRYTFHVEASAAMYLDALAAWYIRAGFRRYFFVVADTEEQRARYRRFADALDKRHFGGGEAGKAILSVSDGRPAFAGVLRRIAQARPDAVVLLLDAASQLDFLGQYEVSGLETPIAGYPEAVTQTRTFYAASHNAAAQAGTGHRGALWEATLDAYGARELNARFRQRWGAPMDPSAWAGYESVKMLYETASFAGTLDGEKLVAYLERPQTSFDVHKGIGVSFRPWDHQLRQTLYLVKINREAKNALDLATLVGELPAIYKPGTDPVERLDQIGVLRGQTECSFL